MQATTHPRRRNGIGERLLVIAGVLMAGLIILASGCSGQSARGDLTLIVSAASALTFAFQEIGKEFEEETGIKVTFNFGSSGQLAQQIISGAPVDLFASADVGFVEEVESQESIVPGTKALYARGRLTLWTRSDSMFQPHSIHDLARPEVKRASIANPDRAPYGVAAREALQAIGIWEMVRPKLVLGENVVQALRYAQTSDVDTALVPLSLSLEASDGQYVMVPEELHRPIDQAMAVIKGTAHEGEARWFAAFIKGPKGRSILERYGYEAPDEGG